MKMKRNGLLAWTMRGLQMLGVYILLLVLWGTVLGHMPSWPVAAGFVPLSVGLVLWSGRGYIWGIGPDAGQDDEFDGNGL